MLRRLRERNEWKFFGVLTKADRRLAGAWWGARFTIRLASAGAAG